MNSKVKYNSDTTLGNSSGNLLNGGLYCEYNDKIYFSNPKDDGNLYVMDKNCKNFKKLRNEKVGHINVAGKYIIYARRANESNKPSSSVFNFSNVGIYRVNKNGKQMKQLYSDPAGNVALYGNYIYFQHYKKDIGLEFYKVKIDLKKEEEFLSKEPVLGTSFYENTLYFSGIDNDHNIKSMDLSTNTVHTIRKGNYYNILVNNGYIYYMDLSNNYSIGRMELDGSNPETIVNDRCASYNISPSGDYLYYQVDNGEYNRLSQINLETKESTVLLAGNYEQIHVTSNYIFFHEFDKTNTYIIDVKDKTTIHTFNPPVYED